MTGESGADFKLWMTREGLDSLDKETLIRLVLAQAETIAALTKQCETLLARVAELERTIFNALHDRRDSFRRRISFSG